MTVSRLASSGYEAIQDLQRERQRVREKISRNVQPILDRLATRAGGSANARLDFSVDDSSGRVVIRIVDGSTNELIRQIPNDAFLKMSAEINRTLGARVDRVV